jgi:hypothetical protein
MMRGGSNNTLGSRNLDDASGGIKMKGWMKKQKETLRSWARRYFTLSGNIMTYYDSEDTSRAPRGVLEITEVAPLTSEKNGLLLILSGGKEVRLIADTHVAYTAWLSLITAAVKKSNIGKDNTNKEGWVHCLNEDEDDEDEWTRYYVVVKNDSFSCYESDKRDAELALAGLVRSVSDWNGKRFGLIVELNRRRQIKLCFDSSEEKTTWLLTLEFAASMKEQSSTALDTLDMTRLKEELPSADNNSSTCPADQIEEADDGVWI